MVVHLISAPAGGAGQPARVGFIVARSVGGAVQRNRVKRQLRHLARARLDRLAPGTWMVVRALPAAAGASAAALARDLDMTLTRVMSDGGRR